MRVAVIGAGAIGAVVAEAAVGSGHDVTVCARTPIDSLVLERERDGQVQPLPVAIADGSIPAARRRSRPGLPDTEGDRHGPGRALAGWLCGPDTLIASAQNGLDHEARLAPYLPAGRVAPALAYMAAERLGPGRVRFLAGNRLVVPVEVETHPGRGGLEAAAWSSGARPT